MAATVELQHFPRSYASVIDRPENKEGHNAWAILEVMLFIQKALQEGMGKHLDTSRGFTEMVRDFGLSLEAESKAITAML